MKKYKKKQEFPVTIARKETAHAGIHEEDREHQKEQSKRRTLHDPSSGTTWKREECTASCEGCGAPSRQAAPIFR